MMRAPSAALRALPMLLLAAAAAAARDPLPTWHDGAAKARIIGFVQAATQETGKDFIPPQQVVGSSVPTRYEMRDGQPATVRLPAVDFIDDKAGKPVGIQRFIGRRPIAAFGNSDGDFEMLEWVTSGPGPRLGLLVHHDDAEGELAYDRGAAVGRLARGLDEAPRRGWAIVSMREDWSSVYPPSAH